ncbi:unnamed protein product [Meganyctiphanes norvegica]|uniref:RING-type domain-containing protein n=1 Tax=Meganyctiphanes norvegica TaxID=48144 RepID=A0AAV2RIC4_MEGNR
MAYQNAPIECGICLEEYDEIRRPRALPCAHHFCSPCLQKYITLGGNKCSVCTRTYTATSIDDFPINTDLEKMIQMWSHMSVNATKMNESSDDENDFSSGYCSIHKKSLVYFKCKTHGIDICHQCAVIEHSPSKCNIIEIKEEILKIKEDYLNKAQHTIDELNSKTTTLESMIVEKNEKISYEKVQIECLLREIDNDFKVCDQAQKSIKENNNMAKQLRECIERLYNANTGNKISKECFVILEKVGILGSFLKELEERNDTESNTKPLTKVSHSVPGTSEAAVAGAQQVVYLDLQGDGKALGRIRIRLTCGPSRRKQMMRLCIGHDGHTWIGASFSKAWFVGQAGEYIYCRWYMTPDGQKSREAITQDLEEEECECMVEGVVTGDRSGAGFSICTRTDPSVTNTLPVLGHIVSGLDLLRQAIRQYATDGAEWGGWDASRVSISDSGDEIIDQ